VLCLGIVFTMAGASAWINYAVDLYGLFGKDARVVYSDERTGKYLLSLRYVPESFDGLLVGSSLTDNWNTAKLDSVRMYNGSIMGGNITEVKIVADNVLSRKRLKVIVFCVHPYLTETHGKKVGGMGEEEVRAAFGSLHMLRDYLIAFQVLRGHRRLFVDEYGVADATQLGRAAQRIRWEQGWRPTSPEPVEMDPAALAEYAELVERARSQGATVIHVNPPIYYDRWMLSRAAYDKYFSQMASLFRPEETAIDFNTPEFDRFRKAPESFADGGHLSPAGADYVMGVLNETIRSCHLAKFPTLDQKRSSARNPDPPSTWLLKAKKWAESMRPLIR